MTNKRIEGVGQRSQTGPLQRPSLLDKLQRKNGIESPQAPDDLRYREDEAGLKLDARSAMRNTGRLERLDASDIPDVSSSSLEGLRGGLMAMRKKKRNEETEETASMVKFTIDADAILRGLDETDPDSPEAKAKIEEILQSVRKLMATISGIPSKGIRDMLSGLVADIMSNVKQGKLDDATALCDSTMNLAKTCADLCDGIVKNINLLRSGLDVKGPARKFLQAAADGAERALRGATSVGQLEGLLDVTTKLVMIGEKLEGLRPGTRAYNEQFSQLTAITGVLQREAEKAGAIPPAESGDKVGNNGRGNDNGRGNAGDDFGGDVRIEAGGAV